MSEDSLIQLLFESGGPWALVPAKILWSIRESFTRWNAIHLRS